MSDQQITVLPPGPTPQHQGRVSWLALGPKNKRQPLILRAAGDDHAVEASDALASLAHQLVQPEAPMLNAPLYMELVHYPWTSLDGLPQVSCPVTSSPNHENALAIAFKKPAFPYWAMPHAHLINPNADAREQACLLGHAVVVEASPEATFGMQGMGAGHQITIVAGQSGTYRRELGNLLQRSIVSFLRHTGRLVGRREDQGDDHLLYLGAQQLLWLRAERHGFFEARLAPGAHFAPDQPLGQLVQPFDAATPQSVSCPCSGIVIATRQVRPVEAGDPIILVGTLSSPCEQP
jgi:hypothetical protein